MIRKKKNIQKQQIQAPRSESGDSPTLLEKADPAADLRQRAEEIVREKSARLLKNQEALSLEETKRTLHELQVHEIELEMQNEELRRVQTELSAAKMRYFDLYDLAPVGYVTLSKKGVILEANLTAATLLGVARSDLVRQPISRFIVKEDKDIYSLCHKQLFETYASQAFDLRMVKKDGTAFWVSLTATSTKDVDCEVTCRIVIGDITERKQAEEALKKSEANLAEAQRIAHRTRMAELEDVNTALKVSVRYRELDKNELQEKILSNVKELIIPYLEKIKRSPLNATQEAYMDIVETNLRAITAPFLNQMTTKQYNLTPQEIQIAALIKSGRSSKDIASILNTSTKTINFHRGNIRKKLGLANKKANLRSNLLSMT